MAHHEDPLPPAPNFNITSTNLLEETFEIGMKAQMFREEIIALIKPEAARFDNVLRPLIDHENAALSRLNVLKMLANVAEDESIREASREAEKQILQCEGEALLCVGIAKLVAVVFTRWQEGNEELDAQDQHFLKRRHSEYLQNGLGITDWRVFGRYIDSKKELNSLLSLVRLALFGSDDGIWIAVDDLAGLSAVQILGLQHQSNEQTSGVECFCTFSKKNYEAVMSQCKRAEVRKRLYLARQNRFKENIGRLRRILELRDEIARILGFANHAELKMEEKMSESVGGIKQQLHEWKDQLQPLAKLEIQRLLELKQRTLRSSKDHDEDDDSEKLYFWDWSFYSNLLRKDEYAVDFMKISQYFEVMNTLQGMLSIFKKLLGIHFEETEGSTWHEDVLVYIVWDGDLNDRKFLGHLYFDLFARKGKYAGANHTMLQPGYTTGDGTRHYAADALICSFQRTAAQPTLLKMNEVRTMFHELGHCIHFLVSKTKYAIYPSRDFIEIPSIMLENWIWVPDVLKQLGRHYSYLSEELGVHYQDTYGGNSEEKISDTVIADYVRTKNLNGAHDLLSQLSLAIFDLEVHTPATHEHAKNIDTTGLWNSTKRDIIGLEGNDEIDASDGAAGFAHIFRKYDAGYFAYPLSKVWAADLYSRGFAANPMCVNEGYWYRKMILEPGASVPEIGLLKNFLERMPNSEAFFSELAKEIM